MKKDKFIQEIALETPFTYDAIKEFMQKSELNNENVYYFLDMAIGLKCDLDTITKIIKTTRECVSFVKRYGVSVAEIIDKV